MAGTTTRTSSLEGVDPVTALARGWNGRQEPVEEADRFWTPRDANTTVEETTDYMMRDEEEVQTRPNVRAVPGWFTLPCDGCTEIQVNVPLPARGQRIIRMLIDSHGIPIRAAVQGCKVGRLHEDIEEYKIKIKEASSAKDT